MVYFSEGDASPVLSEFSTLAMASSYRPGSDNGRLKPSVRAVGVSKEYARKWTLQDAFRELYQNWKDAIIASNALSLREFQPVMQYLETETLVTIHGPVTPSFQGTPGPLLGYIRHNKRKGYVELVNFNAQLTNRALDLGVTTKEGDKNLAGSHGEGLKIAAVVLLRNSHRLTIDASSYHWDFAFFPPSKTELACTLQAATSDEIRKAKEAHSAAVKAGKKLELTPDIREDVAVCIGKCGGARVSIHDFQSWTKAILDLNPPSPSDIIHTDHGDLLLSPEFEGRLYFKGLILTNPEPLGKGYVYGYNFLRGQVNRFREHLTKPSEEAIAITRIWEDAIRTGGDRVLDRYITILQEDPTCAEIIHTEREISRATAQLLWNRLIRDASDCFFYYEKREDKAAKVAEFIQKDLKKKPSEISGPCWSILRHFKFIRTPQEEKMRSLRRAQPVVPEATIFSQSVERALSVCLALNPTTADITVSYVDGADASTDILFTAEKDKKILLVPHRWLEFQTAHESSHCEVSSLPIMRKLCAQSFTCDHIVQKLFEQGLDAIFDGLKLGARELENLHRLLRRESRQLLQHMPRMVEVFKTGSAGELGVSWMSGESDAVCKLYGDKIMYHVTLHRESSCSSKRADLLYTNDPSLTDTCDCQRMTVSQTAGKAVFGNLIPSEEYFPLVARVAPRSFFGLPPRGVKPDTALSIGEIASDNSNCTAVRLPTGTVAGALSFSDRSPADLLRDTTTTDSATMSVHLNPKKYDDFRDHYFPKHEPEVRRSLSSEPFEAFPMIPPSEHKVSISDIDAKSSISMMTTSESDPLTVRLEYMKWQVWNDSTLPKIFKKLISSRETPQGNTSRIPSICCNSSSWRYTFTRGEYVQIKIKSSSSSEQETKYVIFVHDIIQDGESNAAGAYSLLVSKYSFLRSNLLFQNNGSKSDLTNSISQKELLLHFGSLATMGEEQDAEIIRLNDIVDAQQLEPALADWSDTMEYLVEAPQDCVNCGYFCRFAIQSSGYNSDTACLTPVGSNLLRHRLRWKPPRYEYPCKPVVFDLSPNVLGACEGFSQTPCEIFAALGFDTDNNVTWKARHHSARVYDGTVASILHDLATSRLSDPSLPGSGIPKIALVAGANSTFALDDIIHDTHSVDKFLAPLDALDAAATSTEFPAGGFDFLVLAMPSAVLHHRVLPRFLQSVFLLLQRRYCIHLKLLDLSAHGIPQRRKQLVLLASPICAVPGWDFTPQSVTVSDLIGDITFDNPRPGQDGKTAFVCKPAHGSGCNLMHDIYNHQTGLPAGDVPEIDPNSIAAPFNTVKWAHPGRSDLLTIRELARIQGFPDDFIFHQSLPHQYQQVLDAFPPPVAKSIAKTVLSIIHNSRVAKVGAEAAVTVTLSDGDVTMSTSSVDVAEVGRAAKRKRGEE
ncbi:hypothetical protein FQN50_006841 [Emmonsiellopsis sp. PD_5]|nr:hypothetical protein FQN50_006841 [Emmonsiellopsis sp. PD_5]